MGNKSLGIVSFFKNHYENNSLLPLSTISREHINNKRNDGNKGDRNHTNRRTIQNDTKRESKITIGSTNISKTNDNVMQN